MSILNKALLPEHVLANKQQDLLYNIKALEHAISNSLPTQAEDLPKFIELRLLQFEKIGANSYEFIHDYIRQEAAQLHHSKVLALQSLANEFMYLSKISNTARKSGSKYDKILFAEALTKIKFAAEHYASLGGSVYLFRHCSKTKRRKFWNFHIDAHKAAMESEIAIGSQKMYDGISIVDIEKQARKAAQDILREVIISPVPVKVVLRHSEHERTRIFAQIVQQELSQLNHMFNSDKIIFDGPSPDPRIFFSLFPSDFMKEIDAKYKQEGEDVTFFKWWRNEDYYLTLKHSYSPGDMQASLDAFCKSAYMLVTNQPIYTIVIGFSHSFLIDTILMKYCPQEVEKVGKVIACGTCCKIECGQFEYWGHWRNLY